MRIRPARDDDVDALVPLFEEWGHEQPATAVAAQLGEWRTTPRAEVLVAELEGSVAGVVAVVANPPLGRQGRSARVLGLVVATRHHRRGVGVALMRAAEETARSWGCDRVELTSSRARGAAHAFYRALGYQDTSGHHARYVRVLEQPRGGPGGIGPVREVVDGRVGEDPPPGWRQSSRRAPRSGALMSPVAGVPSASP